MRRVRNSSWPRAGSRDTRIGIGPRDGRHQDQAIAIRNGRRRNDARERPAARRDEAPVEQIGRAPIAVRQRHEQVVRVLVPHDDRIGARAVGNLLVDLLEVVAVVDVDRIGVGPPGSVGSERAGHECEQQRATCRGGSPGTQSNASSPARHRCASYSLPTLATTLRGMEWAFSDGTRARLTASTVLNPAFRRRVAAWCASYPSNAGRGLTQVRR